MWTGSQVVPGFRVPFSKYACLLGDARGVLHLHQNPGY